MLLIRDITNLSVRGQMLALSAFFIVINFTASALNDIDYIRLTRVLSTIAVFLFFVIKVGHRSIWIYLLYLLLVCSSFGFYHYEAFYGPHLYLIPTTIAYITLSVRILKGIEWSLIRPYEYISYLLIYGSNIWFHLYNVNGFDYTIGSQTVVFLVILAGCSGITACLLVGFSNATRSTFKAAYYAYAVFAFVFADFATMVAYYFKIAPQLFYFIERSNYLFGLYILTRFCFIDNGNQKANKLFFKKSSQDSKDL